MFKKKARSFIAAAISAALLLSGCGKPPTELVDEITAEPTVLQTSAETTTATAATTKVTTATTTAAATKATAAATTETTTTTAATTEITTTAATTETTTTTVAITETTTTAATTTTAETTTETTTEETTVKDITAELTPEELEIYNSMPDIVFVWSHRYWKSDPTHPTRGKYSNIRGFYITKDCEVKLYAFSDEEEGKYTDVPELYDELEDVTYPELLVFNDESQDCLPEISIHELIELYKKLLLIEKTDGSEYSENCDAASYGCYRLYGIRIDRNGNNEGIFLREIGDLYNENTDPYAKEVYENIYDYSPNTKRLLWLYRIYFPEEYLLIY